MGGKRVETWMIGFTHAAMVVQSDGGGGIAACSWCVKREYKAWWQLRQAAKITKIE
jgi:hypothetical protein